MPHGKPRKGITVVTAKIDEELQKELDRIVEEKDFKNRSDLIRKAIIEYITKFKENV